MSKDEPQFESKFAFRRSDLQDKRNAARSYALCMALPVVLSSVYFMDRPLSRVIATKTISLSSLSPNQKLNIQNAARRLNGVVLRKGTQFSFNGVVGPRTLQRGYLPAPSYVEKGTENTIGGGICLVSSAVYEDALIAGLQVNERVPHMKVLHATPAGLDSTVWYGGADLKLTNNLDSPVELATKYTPFELTVELRANGSIKGWQPAKITRVEHQLPREVQVTVCATQYGSTHIVSKDVYGIPHTGERTR